jgi:hypothetical protein
MLKKPPEQIEGPEKRTQLEEGISENGEGLNGVVLSVTNGNTI